MTTNEQQQGPGTQAQRPPRPPRPGGGGRRGGGGGGRGPRPGGPEGDRGPGGDQRVPRQRRDREEDDSGLIERVVLIRRVAKVVSGGRNLTFNAMVVVGDGQGRVGASLGKSGAVPDAVRKGTMAARKRMMSVRLSGATITHEVLAKFGGCKVLLKPASPGTGIKAGGGVRAVLEASGVRDVLSKTHGSRNMINQVKATLLALEMLKDPKAAIEQRRGAAPAA